MRTYSLLIKYEIDFQRAQSTELRLRSSSNKLNLIIYKRFAQFIALFAELDGDSVRPQYHYGEMHLSRLN
jgi:hypothetical protein